MRAELTPVESGVPVPGLISDFTKYNAPGILPDLLGYTVGYCYAATNWYQVICALYNCTATVYSGTARCKSYLESSSSYIVIPHAAHAPMCPSCLSPCQGVTPLSPDRIDVARPAHHPRSPRRCARCPRTPSKRSSCSSVEIPAPRGDGHIGRSDHSATTTPQTLHH